jgi:hypothetical protein
MTANPARPPYSLDLFAVSGGWSRAKRFVVLDGHAAMSKHVVWCHRLPLIIDFKHFVMILRSAGFVKSSMIRSQNAIDFAYIIYLVLQYLRHIVRRHNPAFSVQDLNAHFIGGRYVRETLKLLPQKPDPILIRERGCG